VYLEPQGFLAGPQTAGDCKRVVCDGQGGTMVVVDNTNVPNDGNPCTLDVCTNGQPSNPPTPAGTSCGTMLVCNGAGACVGCLQNSDCGTSTACASQVCEATGVCAVVYVPSGQGTPSGQTAGNCQKVVCNGSGGTMSIPDDTNVPASTNPCIVAGCSMGQPTQVPDPPETSCGTGLVCNGAGSCQGCVVDTDCGTPTACATPACTAGSCTPGYVPSGQGNPGGQVPGSCQTVVCNGSGGTMNVADDANVPVSTNPCITGTCSGGVPGSTLLPAETTCGAGLVCDGAGNCVGCVSDADCGTSNACATYQCVGSTCSAEYTPAGTGDPGGEVPGSCQTLVCNGSGGTTSVPDDANVPVSTNPCTTGACSAGAPEYLPVAAGTSCGTGLLCNGSACVANCYIGGFFYAAGTVDLYNACQVCTPSASTSAWSNIADTTPCNVGADANDCKMAGQCMSGTCVDADVPEGTLCTTSAYNDPGTDLPYPGVCSGGICWNGCWVNGMLYLAQESGDPNVCTQCVPSESRTTFAPSSCAYDGYFGTCNVDTGVCNLIVASACAPVGCSECVVQTCGTGQCYGLPEPDGTSCGTGMTCITGSCQ
jgi:hypothetical protein